MSSLNDDLFEALRRDSGVSAQDRIEAIERALAVGADVNARRQYGFTPLHDAVARPFRKSLPSADLEVVRFLVEHGADVNAANDAGVCPFDHAIALNDTDSEEAIARSIEVMEFLLERGARPRDDASLATYSCCDVRVYEVLLRVIGNPGAVDAGRSPLHAAVSSQRPALVERLLREDIDHDVVDAQGKTPLGLALVGDEHSPEQKANKARIVEILQARGARAKVPLEPRPGLLPCDLAALRAAVKAAEPDSSVASFLSRDFDSYQELAGELPDYLPTFDDSLPALAICRAALGPAYPEHRVQGDGEFHSGFFHHGDVRVDGNLRITAPFVITGDLIVTGCVRDCGPDSFVVVLGNADLHSLVTDGEFHVGGTIAARGVAYGHYNDNVLCARTIRARLVIEDEHATEGTVEADLHFDIDAYRQGRGEGVVERLRELLVPDVFSEDEEGCLDRDRLLDRLWDGSPVFLET